MLDKTDFSKARQDIAKEDSRREDIIQQSRIIIQVSKQCIYAVHRKDLKTGKQKLDNLKKEVSKLRKIDIPLDTDIAGTAYQEYVEAAAFYQFVTTGKLATSKALSVSAKHYLLGICDLTGELVRRAVDDAINKDFKQVEKIRGLVTEIYGQFLQMNLRNGELRKKSDSIKWNLKKIEDIMYDARMKGMA